MSEENTKTMMAELMQKTVSGAESAKMAQFTKKYEACQAANYFKNDTFECGKHALTSLMFTDSSASVTVYGLTLLLALSMIFLGRCYKKSLYFAIGVLPVLWVAKEYKSDANEWLLQLQNEEEATNNSWFSENFEAVFLSCTILVAAIAGCVAVKHNRFALACIGGLLASFLTKWAGITYYLAPYLKFGDLFSQGVANVFSQVIFILLGALIFCYCFSKVFRNVVPLIGGVLAADSILSLSVWACAKFAPPNWWLSENIFKPQSWLLMRAATRWGDAEKKSVEKVWQHLSKSAQKTFATIAGGEDVTNPMSKLWDAVFAKTGFSSNWPIWSLWLVIAILFYCIGHSRMKKDELREEEIEEERGEQLHYGKRTRGANYV